MITFFPRVLFKSTSKQDIHNFFHGNDTLLKIKNNKWVVDGSCYLLTIVLIFYVLGPFYGILPLKNINSLGIMYTALGNIDCLTKMGLCTPCTYAGTPTGGYMPFGLPYAYISSTIQILTGVSDVMAYNIPGFLFLFLGWFGVFKISRLFGANRFFSFFGGFLFLFMPIVYAKSGYVFMMWAFVSIPFFLWLDLWYFLTKKLILSFPLLLLSKVVLIFLEPYTFVMVALFTYLIIFFQAITAIRDRTFIYKGLIKVTLIALAPIMAYLAYKNYIPDGANYSVMPLNFFRGQGIDLIALFNRPHDFYAFKQFWNVSITDTKSFFTDGESVNHVYFGLSLMLVLPMAIVYRKRISPFHRIFLFVGVVTFILALGPSLKINDQRDPLEIRTNPQTFVFEDYLMPKESATITLPHSFIYQIAPFKYMRSVSRWLLPTILTFIISLMVLITFLWKNNHLGKAMALLIVIWIIFENAPAYKKRTSRTDYFTQQFEKFNADVIPEFRKGVTNEDLVLFIQEGGLSNEYFSTYLCSIVECKSYNVSSDKAVELSMKRWPKEISDALSKPDRYALVEVLKSRLATVLVFPHFDMRWNSYSWPPDQDTKQRFLAFAHQYKDENDNIEFESYEWFSYMRIKK